MPLQHSMVCEGKGMCTRTSNGGLHGGVARRGACERERAAAQHKALEAGVARQPLQQLRLRPWWRCRIRTVAVLSRQFPARWSRALLRQALPNLRPRCKAEAPFKRAAHASKRNCLHGGEFPRDTVQAKRALAGPLARRPQ